MITFLLLQDLGSPQDISQHVTQILYISFISV